MLFYKQFNISIILYLFFVFIHFSVQITNILNIKEFLLTKTTEEKVNFFSSGTNVILKFLNYII